MLGERIGRYVDCVPTWAVQFSADGAAFATLIRFDSRPLAESVMRACAGYGSQWAHPYWRVREVSDPALWVEVSQ